MGLLDGGSFTLTRCNVPSGYLNMDTEPAPYIGWFLLFIVTEVAEQLDISTDAHTALWDSCSYIFTAKYTMWYPFYIFTLHCFWIMESAYSLSSCSASHSCDAAIRARYLPVISLGSGVVPGHGTWPSTSQMHSLRQYFFGPKLAGLEACILASASAFNTSLKTRQRVIKRCSLLLERWMSMETGSPM